MRRNKAYFLFAAALSIGVFGLTNEASASDGNSVNSYIENKIQSGAWGKANETNKINSVFPHYAYRNGVGKPEGFVVHESGTEGDRWSSSDVAMNNEENYMINNWDNAFTHGWVSDNRIDTIANTDYLAWGVAYTGNQRYIQYEQVRLNGKDQWAKQTYNIASIAAQKMLQYGIKPQLGSTLFSHAMISNMWYETSHTDPTGYWATQASSYFGTSYTMDNFAWLVNYIYNQNNYDKIISRKDVNYNITINQHSRIDGVYENGPYNTSADTVNASSSGEKYDGQSGYVSQEVKTSRSTYVNVHLKSGRSFWIDQGATIFVPDKIINTDNANYGVIINQSNRVDGIYTDPYNTTTNSQSPIEFGSAYDGYRTQVRKTVSTSRSTYVNVWLGGRWVWIDKGAVVKETSQNGWYTATAESQTNSDGTFTTNRYYLKNGLAITGEQQIDGKWYLFDPKGFMLTGLTQLDKHGVNSNKIVYYGSNGDMQYGQQYVNGAWRLFLKDTGAMAVGLQDLTSYGANKKVLYGSDGAMQYGEHQISGKWYLFEYGSGAMQYGLRDLRPYGGSKTVYYDSKSGQMVYGDVKISGKIFTFNVGDGALKTGWYTDSNQNVTTPDGTVITNKYYVSNNGLLTGEQRLDGGWYMFNTSGNMITGLTKVSNFGVNSSKTVYYGSDGRMKYGEQNIAGSWYLFDKNTGAMLTGLQYLGQFGGDKTVYYSPSDGKLQYGNVTIDGKTLTFQLGTGAMKVGWYTADGASTTNPDGSINTNKYYVNRYGIVKGEQFVDGHWRLFTTSGNMITGLTKLAEHGLKDNRTVLYNDRGEMQYGQVYLNGHWYLFNAQDGRMMTGFQNLSAYGDNKTVYYSPATGYMLYGTQMIDGKEYTFEEGSGALISK